MRFSPVTIPAALTILVRRTDACVNAGRVRGYPEVFQPQHPNVSAWVGQRAKLIQGRSCQLPEGTFQVGEKLRSFCSRRTFPFSTADLESHPLFGTLSEINGRTVPSSGTFLLPLFPNRFRFRIFSRSEAEFPPRYQPERSLDSRCGTQDGKKHGFFPVCDE